MLVYAKAIVAFAITVLLAGIAQGLIEGAAAAWITIIAGALGTVGVVVTRNRPVS